jgi:hypothetical protein
VHVKAWVAIEPTLDVGMFVSRVDIGNDMKGFVWRCVVIDLLQKCDPILMGMTRTALTQNGPI